MIPGNPLASTIFRLTQGGITSPGQLKATERMLLESFKLYEPLHVQFVDFISNLIRGNLGTSILFYSLSVANLIALYFPWTLLLMIPAVSLSWFVGNYIGVIAAMNRNKFVDKVVLTIFMVLQGIPPYVLGMYLILLLAVYIPIFPTGGGWSP